MLMRRFGLQGARIGGLLDCGGARLTNPTGATLVANSLGHGDLFMRVPLSPKAQYEVVDRYRGMGALSYRAAVRTDARGCCGNFTGRMGG
jgi:hypothetical protein